MSAVKEDHALAELKARAVADSDDRENWLAARSHGVTATEVAKLAKGGAGAKREILAEKLGGSKFSGNMYTEWGRLREAAIAEDVRARLAIEPNSVLFHAAGNPRHLATPDGVGRSFDGSIALSEIKTSKHDLDILHGAASVEDARQSGNGYFWSTGYYDQVLWQIYVCGAAGAWFTPEQHNDDWSGWDADTRSFRYGPTPLSPKLTSVWIPRDDIRIDELVAIADGFLDAYDVALRDAADGVAPEIDDQLDTLAVNLLRFRELEAEGKRSKETTWKEMLDRLEGCDEISQESALARVTWSPGVETTADQPDIEAAKAADPALFAEVQELSKRWNDHAKKFTKTVTSTSRSTLTVTAIKPAKEKKK